MTKVKILKNVVQTGPWKGLKGQVLEVPQAIAEQWIALKAAEPSKEK